MSEVTRRLTLLAVLLGLATLGLWAAGTVTGTAGAAPKDGRPAEAGAPGSPGGGATMRLDDADHSRIQALDDQIKSLRADFHAQLDPLEAQVRGLKEKFEPQIKALEEQKKTLVEQGKSPAMRDLDAQEDSELAALADREKAEVEKVHQRFSDERKDIRQRFQQRRKELQGTKH